MASATHLFRAAGLMAALFTVGCCDKKGPLLDLAGSDEGFRRERLMEQLGAPVLLETTTAGALASKDILEARLKPLLKDLPRDQHVQLIVWETRCWFRVVERSVGVFNPDTGEILRVRGERLLAGFAEI